jgi:hypothetical protein
VIRYLLDSSALWRILRAAALRAAWADADFVTAARYLSDVRERSIIDTPEVG